MHNPLIWLTNRLRLFYLRFINAFEGVMKICGVELKGAEAFLVGIDHDGATLKTALIPGIPNKITMGDDKSSGAVRSFWNSINSVAKDHSIEKFVIKSRLQRGRLAGGAVSFKMEGLFQLVENCNCEFVSAVALAAWRKKCNAPRPDELYEYQSDAYFVACCYVTKL